MQRAAVYAKKHEYPVVQERPIPKLEDDKLLVKVEAVGLNPIDYKTIDYALFGDPPMILGRDVAGTVEEVGPQVTNYKKGDRIITWMPQANPDDGAYQEQVLVAPAPYLTAKLPANISNDEASTLPTSLNTASVALYDSDGFGIPSPFEGNRTFGDGKAALVMGGSSIVGLGALQLFRLSGFSKIVTTASAKHESLVQKYGATHLIDRSLPLDEQVRQITSIAPTLDYVFDAVVGKDTVEVAARSLSPRGGRIVATLKPDESLLTPYKNVSAVQIYANPIPHHRSATLLWTHLEEALKNGDILPLPYKVQGGLDKISEAFSAVKHASGYKVLVHPQE